MFYIGVDLGQRQDHSAIAVVERPERQRAYGEPEAGPLLLRHLERIPLGTPYAGVVSRVREIAGHSELAGRCALAVDATGLGNPVVEMMRASGPGCEIAAVTITGGEREIQQGTQWSVPKRDLIAGVQVLLDQNELRIARGLRELGALVQELVDVRMTARANGRVRLGADGCGEHDDLVMAVALACWRGKKKATSGFGGRRLPGL